MKKWFILLLLAFMVIGCSPINPPEAEQQSQADTDNIVYDLLGPGPINYGVIRDEYSVIEDEQNEIQFDGMMNHSPTFKTLNRHRDDLGDNEEKIRSILLQEEGVRPSAIFIIGKDIWVNVTLVTANIKEREQKQIQLQQLLSQAMQEYNIHLRVNEKK